MNLRNFMHADVWKRKESVHKRTDKHTQANKTRSVDSRQRRQHSTNHNHYTAEFIGCWCFLSISLVERRRAHVFTCTKVLLSKIARRTL